MCVCEVLIVVYESPKKLKFWYYEQIKGTCIPKYNSYTCVQSTYGFTGGPMGVPGTTFAVWFKF